MPWDQIAICKQIGHINLATFPYSILQKIYCESITK